MSWEINLGFAPYNDPAKVIANEYGVFILSTTNVGGMGSVDIFLSKLDHSGSIKWAKYIGSSGAEQSSDFAIDSSGTIFISYFAASNIIALDQNANILWAKSVASSPVRPSSFNAVAVTEDALYIVGGYQPSYNTTYFVKIAKDTGEVVWAKFIPISGSGSSASGKSLCVSSDGSSILSLSDYTSNTSARQSLYYKIRLSDSAVISRLLYAQSATTPVIVANAVHEYNGLPVLIQSLTSHSGTGFNQRGLYIFQDSGSAVVPITALGLGGSGSTQVSYYEWSFVEGDHLYVAFSSSNSTTSQSYVVKISLLNKTVLWTKDISHVVLPMSTQHAAYYDGSIVIVNRDASDTYVKSITISELESDSVNYPDTVLSVKNSLTTRAIAGFNTLTTITANSTSISQSVLKHPLSPNLTLARMSGYLAGG